MLIGECEKCYERSWRYISFFESRWLCLEDGNMLVGGLWVGLV